MTANHDHRHSQEQQAAESIILEQVAQHLSLNGIPVTLEANPTEWGIKLDGYCPEPLTFVEVWARIGKAKPAQRHKIMNDCSKLLLAEKRAGQPARKILAVVCDEAISFLQGKGWQQQFAREFGIEIVTVQVPETVKESIRAAQERQGWEVA